MKFWRMIAAGLVGLTAMVSPEPSLASPDEQATTPDAERSTSQNDEKPQTRSLTIASWGGAYSKSQEIAFIKPFRSETGISVSLVDHKGSFDRLKQDGSGSSIPWDVVDLGRDEFERACRDGLLEKIAFEDIAGNEPQPADRDDFLPGALHECGVASVAWSAAVVFDMETFKKAKPRSVADFFDTEKFPGKRTLPNGPKYTLELALLGDGVAPEEVYKKLESEEGLSQALKQLGKIRDNIVWWGRSYEPLRRLADGTVSMALAFNGRIFNSIVREGRPFGIIWDGQIYHLDMWAVPKGTPNKTAAFNFISYSIQPDRLAEQTKWFPYGPMRKSAIAMIGRHAEADVEMQRFVPTVEANFKRALMLNGAWWRENETRLEARFKAWWIAPYSASTGEDAETENRYVPSVKKAKPRRTVKKRKRKKNRR